MNPLFELCEPYPAGIIMHGHLQERGSYPDSCGDGLPVNNWHEQLFRF